MSQQPALDVWDPRLDLIEALEAADWIGDVDFPLSLLRKNVACLGVTNGCISLTGRKGWTVDFPLDTPDAVVVAACLAAAEE
jgi:hypothetical protein